MREQLQQERERAQEREQEPEQVRLVREQEELQRVQELQQGQRVQEELQLETKTEKPVSDTMRRLSLIVAVVPLCDKCDKVT